MRTCLAALLLGLIACGTEVTVSGGSGSGGASSATRAAATGSGPGPTSTGAGGGLVEGCPPGAPTEGSPCADPGIFCEYLGGPIVACREVYECASDGAWLGHLVDCSPYPSQMGCPAAMPLAGANCGSGDGTLCLYGGTQCGCTACPGGPCMQQAIWVCVPPPGGGCPIEAPNFGQPCSPNGLMCNYGACGIGTQAERDCTGGVWIDVDVECPV